MRNTVRGKRGECREERIKRKGNKREGLVLAKERKKRNRDVT